MKILILGGTTQASILTKRLAGEGRHDVLLSFAGRTANPVLPPVPCRVGGFGGVDGLIRFLGESSIDVLVDATHPFAAQMSLHAVHAVRAINLPLLRLQRPAWEKCEGDLWTEVADMHAAARALGTTARRVFLPIGKLEIGAFSIAPQHDYLIRAVDSFTPPPELDRARVITARGPFAVEDEVKLMNGARIEIVVSKNSGAAATSAKIVAARRLGIPVVMVARPALPEAQTVATVEAALDWIENQHAASVLRGE
ncbi:MAG: cobalt-precorrin-6A reductase [Pseudomonadota bacterium]